MGREFSDLFGKVSLPTIVRLGLLMLIMAALITAPWVLPGYELRFVTRVWMWIGLAAALNIIAGYTGYLPFGNVVFFGVGAYTVGILMVTFKMPFLPSLIIAGAACVAIALIIGLPTLRLRGAYFAMATLALSEAVRELVVIDPLGVTGGGYGLPLPIYTEYRFFYYLMLSAMVSVILATYLIERSRFGYVLKAIRADEEAAQAIGINTVNYKMAAFALSSFWPGIIGGTYAYWASFIEPSDAFGVVRSIQVILMLYFGGAGTLLGPIIGGASIMVINEILWTRFIYSYLIIVGAIIVMLVMFMPKGIVGMVQRKVSPRKMLKL